MKIVIIGAGGIIGQHMHVSIPDGVQAIFTRRQQDPLHEGLNACDTAALAAFLDHHQPDAVVNLAGENRPDVVEESPKAYELINCKVPAAIAAWCRDAGAHFVQVSTQAVFNGRNAPYRPDSERDAVNAYGQQKLMAEILCREVNPSTTIVRPTFVLGVRPMPLAGRENPVERWLSPASVAVEGQADCRLREVNNRLFSVSFAWDVAADLWRQAVGSERGNTVHVGGGVFSRYGLAIKFRSDVEGVAHETFPGLAERPLNTSYSWDFHDEWIDDGLATCKSSFDSRKLLLADQREREMALFFERHKNYCFAQLRRGFGPLHNDVAEDFRRFNPQDDAQLLEWYRQTDAYIWELSAYHLDRGFNYRGMCKGIAEALAAKYCKRVLCLGDGIGDLTITLRLAGIEAVYHDLAGSRTADFAGLRQWMYLGSVHSHETGQWNPEVLIVPRHYDAIASLDFLEHVTDVRCWLRTIFAALKPGGWFLGQNAFGIGSGPNGSMPMHLERNDRYEKEYGPLMLAIGFEQEGVSNWWRKPQ